MISRRTVGMVVVLAGLIPCASAQERMPPIPPDKMTDAQKVVAAQFKALRGSEPTAPPWSVLLRVPDHVIPALQIRQHYTDRGVLGPRLTELAILINARHWTSNWVWTSHAPAAATAGLKPAIIAAIAEGRRPEGMAEDEAIVYEVCTELESNRSVSDATYARALAAFGEPGVVEIATVEGYYTYIAMVANVARVGAQPNATPPLERFPR